MNNRIGNTAEEIARGLKGAVEQLEQKRKRIREEEEAIEQGKRLRKEAEKAIEHASKAIEEIKKQNERIRKRINETRQHEAELRRTISTQFGNIKEIMEEDRKNRYSPNPFLGERSSEEIYEEMKRFLLERLIIDEGAIN